MKTLGVQITAFREERFIQPVINQFKGLAKVAVAVSMKPWFGNLEPDNTFNLAVKTGALCTTNYWKSEKDQRNEMMDFLDTDYVLVCHADTFFTRKDIKKIIDFIQTATERQYDIPSLMYWKNFDTTVFPDPLLKAMLIRNDVRFIDSIRIEDMAVDAPQVPVVCHHLSWAKTDKEVKDKIDSYSHALEITPNWYENVWKKDKRVDFAPTNPSDYKFTKSGNLPKEIRRYFEVS